MRRFRLKPVLLTLLVGLPARAQQAADPEPATDAAEAAKSAADGRDDSVERARELYREGSQRYEQGHYLEAVVQFKEAHALTGSAPLLFNIAQAYRLAGEPHCEEAHDYYEQYLLEEPTAPNRVEVLEFVAQLKVCVTESAPVETPAPAAIPPPAAAIPPPPAAAIDPGPTSAATHAGWTTVAGAVSLLVGAGLYVPMRVKYADQRENCPCEPGSFATYETLTNVSYALIGVGAATMAAGGVWWLTATPQSKSVTAVLNVGGRF